VILALYGRLLRGASPFLGELGPRTPREIEAGLLRRFPIRPATARTLTGIFEEARYSTHPLDAGRLDQTRGLFREVIAELDARRPDLRSP
jgi:Domain of unknown function (DUF4129)